jgi:hypothetical protein
MRTAIPEFYLTVAEEEEIFIVPSSHMDNFQSLLFLCSIQGVYAARTAVELRGVELVSAGQEPRCTVVVHKEVVHVVPYAATSEDAVDVVDECIPMLIEEKQVDVVLNPYSPLTVNIGTPDGITRQSVGVSEIVSAVAECGTVVNGEDIVVPYEDATIVQRDDTPHLVVEQSVAYIQISELRDRGSTMRCEGDTKCRRRQTKE